MIKNIRGNKYSVKISFFAPSLSSNIFNISFLISSISKPLAFASLGVLINFEVILIVGNRPSTNCFFFRQLNGQSKV
jgi:glutaminase